MRSLILSLLFLLLTFSGFGQQVPNSSFETWSNTFFWESPDSFYSSSPQSYMQGATPNVSKSVVAHSGSFSAKLSTVVGQAGDTIPGMLALGDPTQGGVSGGIAYNAKPDSISFWAKHTIAAGDTAVVMFAFHRQGVLGGFMLMNIFGNVSNYTQYKASVQWFMPPTNYPDTMTMLFLTSGFDGPKTTSSEIWLDDIVMNGSVPQIPNSGLEDWTTVESFEADPWTSLNAFTAMNGTNSLTRSTDSYHGTYAARIESVEFFDDTMGLLVLGELFSEYPSGGMAVSHNPRRLTGYYKYSPVGPDTALAGLFSYYWNNALDSLELIEQVIMKLAPSNGYQPFSVDLSYNGWPWIDSLAIAFASGNFLDESSYIGLGSVLLVDSLKLEYYATGFDEHTTQMAIKVFPNPANDFVTLIIDTDDPVLFDLYTMLGQKVYSVSQGPEQDGSFRVPVGTVASGDYLFVIRSGQGLSSGKLRISH